MRLDKDKLSLVLAKRQLTISEAAKACDVSRNRMYVIMNSQNISPKTVGKIAERLRVEPIEIIETN